MGVRSLSLPGSRGSKQSLKCPVLCCNLGKWFVGITHGFIDLFFMNSEEAVVLGRLGKTTLG